MDPHTQKQMGNIMRHQHQQTPRTASEMIQILREQIFRLHKSMPDSDVARAVHKRMIEQKRAELRTYEEKASAQHQLRRFKPKGIPHARTRSS
jgi:hypothetical protein